MPRTDRINHLNSLLILLTCALAHYFPYSLLLFAYAFLGPAHYLTQISWLHDRRYFVTGSAVPALMVIIAVDVTLLPHGSTALFMAAALGLAFAAVLPLTHWQRAALTLLAIGLAFTLRSVSASTVFLVQLLPTVIHVFLFTAAFIWLGALKSRGVSAYISLFALLAGAASFLLLPVIRPGSPAIHSGTEFFLPVVHSLRSLPGLSSPESVTRLFGFLSFAYTYHYLNWFSKAEIIQWHRIPRLRLYIIALIYLSAIGLYLHDFATGFTVLLFLSTLHVLLELPLNFRTFGAIGQICAQRWSPRP